MKLSKLTFLLFQISFLINSCGAVQTGQIGGIVDNGNSPSRDTDTPKKSDGSNEKDPVVSNSEVPAKPNAGTKYSILTKKFEVIVPSNLIQTQDSASVSEFSRNGYIAISFNPATKSCDYPTSVDRNAKGFEIRNCPSESSSYKITEIKFPSEQILRLFNYSIEDSAIERIIESLAIATSN